MRQSSDHLLGYAPPTLGPQRRSRLWLVTGLAAVLLVAAATVPIGGATLIGFRYRARINNEFTVCPDLVVSQFQDTITLSTGERFRVLGATPASLTSLLAEAGGYVRIERNFNSIAFRVRGVSCGNRPEQGQLITIPLIASETVHTHIAKDYGDVLPLSSTP